VRADRAWGGLHKMSKETFLVILPKLRRGKPPAGKDDFDELKNKLQEAHSGKVVPFPKVEQGRQGKYAFPKLKVGTLDSLMEASDESNKVDASIEDTISKIKQMGDQLRLEVDAEKKPQREGFEAQGDGEWQWVVTVGAGHSGSLPHKYIHEWEWDEAKHTHTRLPLSGGSVSLLSTMAKRVADEEEKVRGAAIQYAEAKVQLQAADKRAHGSLMHRDLTEYIQKWKEKVGAELETQGEGMKELWEKVLQNRTDTDGRWDGTVAVPGVGLLFVCVPKSVENDFLQGYSSWGMFGRGSDDEKVYEEWLAKEGYREGQTNHKSAGSSIAQIELYSGEVLAPRGAVASTQGPSHLTGFSPFVDGDTGEPANALEGDDKTFFDANVKSEKGGLVLTFDQEIKVDSYRIRTSAGDPSCDPCDWVLQGWSTKSGPAGTQSHTLYSQSGQGRTIQLEISESNSEEENMQLLSQQLEVPAGKHVQVFDETGLPVTLTYEDVQDVERLTWSIADGAPATPYSQQKKTEMGSWVTMHTTTNWAGKSRREWTEKMRCSGGGGTYKKFRFKVTKTKGKPDFGPLAYVPFAAIPGTAVEVPIKTDDDKPDANPMQLWAVMVFKHKQQDFIAACRERKLTVRTFDVSAEEFEREKRSDPAVEFEKAKERKAVTQKNLKTKILGAFDECYAVWIHVKAVRVYVEAILRYGLPADFVCCLFHVDSREEVSMRSALQKVVESEEYQKDFVTTRGYEDADDSATLQEKYPYVSLRVPNLTDKA